MTNVLIRHELLRHTVIRVNSFSLNKFKRPQELAQLGFYYCKFSQRIFCFSCHFNVKYAEDYTDIHSLHKKWMENKCFFLKGIDITINPQRNELESKCGYLRSDHQMVFNQNIENFEDFEFSISNPPIDNKICCLDEKTGFLPPFHSPILIPSVDERSTLNVLNYFQLMKNVDMRKSTFRIPNYYFNNNLEMADKIAERGFFYTLFNGIIQCAYCGLLLSGINKNFERGIEMNSIDFYHELYNLNCLFILNRRANPLEDLERTVGDKQSIALSEIADNKERDSKIIDLQSITNCVVCMTNQKEYMCFPCCHFTMCGQCNTQDIKLSKCKPSNKRHCLICRQEAASYRRVYFS